MTWNALNIVLVIDEKMAEIDLMFRLKFKTRSPRKKWLIKITVKAQTD